MCRTASWSGHESRPVTKTLPGYRRKSRCEPVDRSLFSCLLRRRWSVGSTAQNRKADISNRAWSWQGCDLGKGADHGSSSYRILPFYNPAPPSCQPFAVCTRIKEQHAYVMVGMKSASSLSHHKCFSLPPRDRSMQSSQTSIIYRARLWTAKHSRAKQSTAEYRGTYCPPMILTSNNLVAFLSITCDPELRSLPTPTCTWTSTRHKSLRSESLAGRVVGHRDAELASNTRARAYLFSGKKHEALHFVSDAIARQRPGITTTPDSDTPDPRVRLEND